MRLFKRIREVGIILCTLLFLYLLNPYSLFALIGYPLCAYILLRKSFVSENIDRSLIYLLLFSVAYAAFYTLNPVSGVQYILVYLAFPSCFYLIGKYLGKKLPNADDRYMAVLLIGAAYSLTAILSVIMAIRSGDFYSFERNFPLFWSGNVITATKMGSYLTINMLIPSFLITKQRRWPWWITAFWAGIFAVSLFCAIRLGSRTQIAILMITFLMGIFYVFPRQSYRRNISLLFLLGIGAYLIYTRISFDLSSDWLAAFAGRMQNDAAGDIASGGGRTSRWIKSFEYLFTHPLGWDVTEFGLSHNLWLDVLRAGGVVCLILLLVFSVKSFQDIRKFLAGNRGDITYNFMTVTTFMGLFLVFMVEPVMDGIVNLFILFCLYKGLLTDTPPLKEASAPSPTEELETAGQVASGVR